MTENHPPYRSPVLLSRLALVGVGLVGLCELISLLVGLAQIFDPSRNLDLADGDATPLWLLFQGLVALAQFPAFIFAVVVFLMWLFRTYKNLPALQADNVEFTAGWAVGWWFIPLANLIKPFQVVRNVWAESDPDVDFETGFLTSVQAGAPAFMAVWWAFWILANVGSNIASRVMDADDPASVEIGGYVFVGGAVLWLIATALVIKVIMTITQRQEQRFARLGARQYHAEPPPPPQFDQNDTHGSIQ